MPAYDLSRAVWCKSAHSGQNGSCVEVAIISGPEGYRPVIAVRDSKDPGGPKLIFSRSKWNAFTARVKNGGLDLA
jgi:Domain of unknown function (DUF397)